MARSAASVLAQPGVRSRALSRLPALLREAALVTVLLLLYNAGRLLAARRVGGAMDDAHDLWRLERAWHLPSELALQSVVLRVPDLAQAANLYYASVHFPLTVSMLVWLFVRRPSVYLWTRRSLVTATAAGLVLQVLLPTAPPRMLTDLGFVDTGLAYGQSVYGPVGQDTLSNQFAAMPSLHVGWAVLLAVVFISSGRSRWRWLWVLHPVTTFLVVVVTGNHYVLDGLVGTALVLAALLLHRHVVRPSSPAPVSTVWPVRPDPTHTGCRTRRRPTAGRTARPVARRQGRPREPRRAGPAGQRSPPVTAGRGEPG